MNSIIRIFVLVVIVGITIIGCTQETTEEYPNLRTAMGKGAAGDRGWVPEFVPASATNLKIAYIVETNEVWLIFEADSKDLTRILRDFPTPKNQRPPFPRKAPSASWWPKSLTSTLSKAEGGWNFFMLDTQRAGAIDLKQQKAYYWDLGS